MNLKRQVFFGSLWNLLGSAGQQLISFALFIYIARKVGPADVGLVAFALIFVTLLGFCSRMGQVEALQREEDLSDETASTSFWMLIAIGLAASALLLAAAGFTEAVSHDATFAKVLALLAPVAALQAWTAVPEAILRRRFAYRSLAIRHWAATLAGGLLGAYLAYHDYGVFALVGQRLLSSVAQTATTFVVVGWRPIFRFNWDDARRLWRTGRHVMLAGLASTLNLRIADGITGFTLGAAQLGALRLGLRFFDVLSQLSATPVSSVSLSTFSRLQHDRPALARAYLRLTQLMALSSLPVFFGLSAIADVFVPFVLGEKWTESIVVIQLLGFLILAGTVNFFFAPLMIAVGNSATVFRQGVGQVLVTVVFVLVGSQFGVVGVMIAIIARALVVAVYNAVALTREVGLERLAIVKALAPPAIASAVMFGVVEFAKAEIGDSLSPLPLLAILIPLGALTYGAALVGGDFSGLWRRYVRSTISSLSGMFAAKKPDPNVTAA